MMEFSWLVTGILAVIIGGFVLIRRLRFQRCEEKVNDVSERRIRDLEEQVKAIPLLKVSSS